MMALDRRAFLGQEASWPRLPSFPPAPGKARARGRGRPQQALQLANQSKQLPDLHPNTLGLPIPALVKKTRVSEIMIAKESLDRLPEGSFTEGVTNLEGKLYGLPLFSFRQYSTATWFNRDIIAKAGTDGGTPPATYDEFIEDCKKVKNLNGARGGLPVPRRSSPTDRGAPVGCGTSLRASSPTGQRSAAEGRTKLQGHGVSWCPRTSILCGGQFQEP